MINYVLILAAGLGSRCNSTTPKQFLEIDNLPIVMHSVKAFYIADPNAKIYIALPKEYMLKWPEICKKYKFEFKHEIYTGGGRRIDTVRLGLQKISTSSKDVKKKKLVSIHDSARPFIDSKFILKLMSEAKKSGNAVPFVKLKNSLRHLNTDNSLVTTSQNREHYIATQTPQVFDFKKIFTSYQMYFLHHQLSSGKHLFNPNKKVFDDASVYDYMNPNNTIHLVEGREYNIKITTKLDYFIAERMHTFFKKTT